MKKVLIGFLCAWNCINAQVDYYNFATGCLVDTAHHEMEFLTYYTPTRGSSSLPKKYSLKQWAPIALSQNDTPSCTSWASAYAAMTIVKSVEAEKKLEPFSPLCVFNKYHVQNGAPYCVMKGCYINQTLEILKESGCDLKKNHNSCKPESVYERLEHKIYDYRQLAVDVETFKSYLSKNQPIVAAFYTYNDREKNWRNPESWVNTGNLNDGVWKGFSKNWDYTGGAHAMCIVGYNDNLQAFEIMNSWGSNWGDQGFFWVKYEDLASICYKAYAIEPKPKSEKKVTAKPIVKNSDKEKKDTKKPSPKPDPVIEKKLASGVYGHKIKFINSCVLPVYVSLSQFKHNTDYSTDNWETEGWYKIETNSSIVLDVDDRIENSIYWMASNEENHLYWHNKFTNNENAFCNNPTQRFNYINSRYIDNMRSDKCDHKMGYLKITPPEFSYLIVQELGCTKFANRGGGIDYMPNVVIDIIENQEAKDSSKLNSGVYYTSSILFDYFTGNIIQENDDGKYVLYLKDVKSTEVQMHFIDKDEFSKYENIPVFSNIENYNYYYSK